MSGRFPRMHSLFADSGYAGRQNKTLLGLGWMLHVLKRPTKKAREKGVFIPVQKRWLVERTFSWLGIFRRLYLLILKGLLKWQKPAIRLPLSL